jgi:hypothetical protein
MAMAIDFDIIEIGDGERDEALQCFCFVMGKSRDIFLH